MLTHAKTYAGCKEHGLLHRRDTRADVQRVTSSGDVMLCDVDQEEGCARTEGEPGTVAELGSTHWSSLPCWTTQHPIALSSLQLSLRRCRTEAPGARR